MGFLGDLFRGKGKKEAAAAGAQNPYGQFRPEAPGQPALSQGQGQPSYKPYNPRMDALKPQVQPADAKRFGAAAQDYAAHPEYAQYTEQPKGWDMRGAGTGEQFWDRNQGRVQGPSQTTQAYQDAKDTFAAPGQGEQYWQQVQGKFNQPTNAQGAYDRAAKQSADPGLGAYYDRAKQTTANSMNDQLAAMGLMGSSVGGYQMGQALSNLDAERANREADFTLRQNQALSQMGSTADTQNQNLLGQGGQMANAAEQLGLTRNTYGINAANAADSADLSRFNAGMAGAMGAQDARRTRAQDMFSNVYGPANALAGIVGDAQNSVIGNDKEYLDAVLAAEGGRAKDNANYYNDKYSRQINDENHALEQTKGWMSVGSGGGGMMGGGGGQQKVPMSYAPYNEQVK